MTEAPRNSRLKYLEVAERIAARLCRDAHWSGGACNWFGWTSANLQGTLTPMYRALGPSDHNQLSGLNLYSGTSGIALFLARLCHAAEQPSIVSKTLRGVVQQIVQQSSLIQESDEVGFYTGQAGIAYALIEIGTTLSNADLIERGLILLRGLTTDSIDSQKVDLIEGRAGMIPVLIEAGQRFDSSLQTFAIEHGQQLLQLADRTADGWSWDTIPVPVQQHLTGFSHGVSGVVFAMLELYRSTNDAVFLEAAEQGMRYERNQFCAAEQNWLDHQVHETNEPHTPRCRTAWCHGAPGIGMARLIARQLLPDDSASASDLQIAMETTAADVLNFGQPGERDWCLCHGHAGNADLFLQAADVLNEPQHRDLADEVGDWGIEHIHQNRLAWPAGINGTGESPDLMTGLAGVGYFYLRLFDSRSTPSILLVRSQSMEPAP